MTAFDARLTGLDDKLSGQISEVRGEIKAMGAKVALANGASSMTIAGLVLAAAKLF